MNLSPFQAKHTKTYLLIDTDTICDMCYVVFRWSTLKMFSAEICVWLNFLEFFALLTLMFLLEERKEKIK